MRKTFNKNDIEKVAKEILGELEARSQSLGAMIVALSGDLGAGKTTLTQTIARELGVRENVISPTFILMKSYELRGSPFKNLVHIDAYRFDSYHELERLGWDKIISDKTNLVLLEWPEKVSEIIPESAIKIKLSHINENEREIEY